MNATNFEKWFQEKLIPALPTSTLIVMDNASKLPQVYIMLKAIVFNICMYLSCHLEEQPKQKWRKAQMKEWLDSKGTIFCTHCGRSI